jgi:cytochrome c peroxidase
MTRSPSRFCRAVIISCALSGIVASPARAQLLKPQRADENTYLPVVPTKSFDEILRDDSAARDDVMSQQKKLLDSRYDLGNDPSNVKMSGNRKAVQQGVRVKLHGGATWEKLAGMSPEEIKKNNMFPYGFRPLPHVKHAAGGMVFPQLQIDEIQKQEARDLRRFDVDFDLPDHLTPEFPPPMFLTSRPDLGDVTQGQVLTIKNYYRILHGKVTPVQMEGMRL